MAQVVWFKRRLGDEGWNAFVILPSEDPRSKHRGAILCLAEAIDIATRKEVQVKAVATGDSL